MRCSIVSANCGLRLPLDSQETLRGGFVFLYFLGFVPDFSSETSFQQFENFARIDEGPHFGIAEPHSRPFHDFRVTREVYRMVDDLLFDSTFTTAFRDWNPQALRSSSSSPITFHECM